MNDQNPFKTDVDTSKVNETELAQDLTASVDYLTDELFNGEGSLDEGADIGGTFVPPAGQLLPMIMPYIHEWAENYPEEAIIALEIMNKESAALLEKHTEENNE